MSEETVQAPGPIELYILAAGLVLGILLGPAVLGRLAPAAHASLFGGGPATQQLLDYKQETAAMVDALEATGVTPAAVDEQLELRSMQDEAIRQARDAVMDRNASQKILVIVIALFTTMMIEALYPPIKTVENPASTSQWLANKRNRLNTLGYAFVAIALTIIISRPGLLLRVDFSSVFFVMVFALVILGPLMPNRKNLHSTG